MNDSGSIPKPVQKPAAVATATTSSAAAPPASLLPEARQAAARRPQVTVPLKARMQFFQQLATLIKSGISPAAAFEHLARETSNAQLREAAAKGQICASRGGNLSAWMNTKPTIFSKREATLTLVGEMGGTLDTVFARIAQDLEDDLALKRRLFLATFISKYFLLPLLLLVPGMSNMLVNGYHALPNGGTGLTPEEAGRRVFHEGLRQYLTQLEHRLIPIVLIGGLGYLAWRVFITTTIGRAVHDHIVLWIPVTGALWRDIAISRYLDSLGMLTRVGLTSAAALEACVGIADNVALDEKFERAAKLARQHTLSIVDALTQVNILSGPVLSLIRTGDQTGSMPEMLNKAAQYYESTVEGRRVAIPRLVGIVVFLIAAIATAIVLGTSARAVFDGMFTVGENIAEGG
jgi:type IV pilus assembly protein PilC